jgi:hypothetical protein
MNGAFALPHEDHAEVEVGEHLAGASPGHFSRTSRFEKNQISAVHSAGSVGRAFIKP